MQVQLLTHYINLFYNKNKFSNENMDLERGEFCEMSVL